MEKRASIGFYEVYLYPPPKNNRFLEWVFSVVQNVYECMREFRGNRPLRYARKA